MAVLTSQIIAQLVDRVSGPAAQAAAAVQRLTAAARRATVTVPVQRISRGMQQMAAQANHISQTVSGPLTLITALAGRAAYEFEKAGNMLEALGEATRQQRADFERYANQLNSEFPQSLAEIIRTGNEMIKAGFTFDQMRGAIRQTLAAAILGDLKPSELATIMSSAINAFQLPMQNFEQSMRSSQMITDRMTYAAVKTQTSLRGMGDTFRYVAAAAAASGTELDTVTGFAMALARNGIIGSEAGVVMRSNIVRLVRPTRQALASLERIGMRISDYQTGKRPITTDGILSGLTAGGIDASALRSRIDAMVNNPALQNAPLQLAQRVTAMVQEHLNSIGSAMDADKIAENVQESIIAAGNKVDLLRFFEDLRKKMAEGIATQADLATIFEGRHFARNNALLQNDIGQIIANIKREAEGITLRQYAIANQGIVGAVRDFTAALEELAVAFGRSVFPDLARILKQTSQAIQNFAGTNPVLLKTLSIIAAVIIAMAPLGLIVTGAVAVFKMLAGAATVLVGALSPVGAAIMAVVVALGALAVWGANNWSGLTAFASGFADTIAQRFPAAASAVGWISTKFGELMGWLGRITGTVNASTETWRGWGVATADAIANMVELLGGLAAAVGRGLVAAGAAIATWASGLASDIAGWIASGATSLFEAGSKLMDSFLEGIKAKVAQILDYVKSIPSRITGLLGAIQGAVSGGGSTPTAPARASGGRVNAGTAYGVGERGREIFVPDGNGTILANRGRASAGGAGSGGGNTVHLTANFTYSGSGLGEADWRRAANYMNDQFSARVRGLFADYGISATA